MDNILCRTVSKTLLPVGSEVLKTYGTLLPVGSEENVAKSGKLKANVVNLSVLVHS